MTTSWAPSTFKDLQEQLRAEGLFQARPAYYVGRILTVLALLALAFATVGAVGDSWWQLAVAVFLAFCFGQSALLLHDAGHGQISRGGRVREYLGFLFGNLLLGISASWWVSHHNRHHNFPNQISKDPDLLNRPVVVSSSQSTGAGWAQRLVIRHQAWLFVPLLMFDALGFRVLSMVSLARRRVLRPVLEITLIGIHFAGYVGVLAGQMPASKAVAFVIIHHLATGLYIGAMLAPNHKGMPVVGDDLDWVSRQVLTARNIRGGRLVDFVYGGLNYQIEHHLFPTLPRPNLRPARPIVKEFCERNQLRYHEVGIVRSYVEATSHLALASRSWRQRRRLGAAVAGER